jgi:hypothetical protein
VKDFSPKCTFVSISTIALSVLLVACGSESDSNGNNNNDNNNDNDNQNAGTAPNAPSLSLTGQSIKTFAFDWPEVSGATGYRLLENPDDVSGYTEIASIAADATSHELDVFLPGRINASYILEACNSDGCTDSTPVFVDTNLAEAVGYFKASNADEDDQFGYSVALSADGSTMAIGAREEQSAAMGIEGNQADNSANASGAVYVFQKDGDNWQQQAYVKASNTDAVDWFGEALALSDDGNTLAVGARLEDSNATGIDGDQSDNSANASGAAYVFVRDDNDEWTQQAYLKASNAREDHEFGVSVSLSGSGDLLAVGAHYEDSAATGVAGDQVDDSSFKSGAVYVFSRSSSAWTQQAYIKASNTDAGNDFGTSVALSADGQTLAVGSDKEDSSATGINGDESNKSEGQSGAVYVYFHDGTSWSQQAYIKASNTAANDWFGNSVTLSADGNTLAVGAYGEDSQSTGIGADQSNDFSTSTNEGAVYVFTRSGTSWSQQEYLKASSMTGTQKWFGLNVDLSADGNILAVAARREKSNATGINGDQEDTSASNSGAVYVFTRDQVTWSQQAYVKATNTRTGNWFSMALGLSADGNSLAVGSPREASAAKGINGDQSDINSSWSGAVYLY